MAQIVIEGMTFAYKEYFESIFEKVATHSRDISRELVATDVRD